MDEALPIPGVWRQFTSTSLFQAFNNGLQQNCLSRSCQACWLFNKVTYRFASTIVPHYQGQRPIKLHDMLIIRAEGPDALDQHLQHIETNYGNNAMTGKPGI